MAGSWTELCKRDYTLGHFAAARCYRVIDFALHEKGPATSWASHAAPGEVLEIEGANCHHAV
ncbi:siderophore-interacting protein [Ochrobactrum sp. BTU1]|uniref:siderophore-interacting protein n=1 Tax=Ochrobactrum sp. BTU1 TaxID=2840456 RepID=UPI001C0406BD|nr:siderophore-interacting protein [Ochrobactrum sp. BTU1]